MYEVKTESGRTYHIDTDRNFFRRLPKNNESLSIWVHDWMNIWAMKRGTEFNWPHLSADGAWEDGFPEVGKFMYISGKDVWWVTTEITSIEEIKTSG